MQYNFDTYYWQDDKIRLRTTIHSDAEYHNMQRVDVLGSALVAEHIPLTPIFRIAKNDAEPIENNESSPNFTIETLSGEYVGSISFHSINERNGAFSISMGILKGQRRKGYGKAAMNILLEYAFNERRWHRFEGYCLDINTASAKMMESLGCVREGVNREAIFFNGKYHDRLLYSLLENEYRERKK